MRAMVPPGTPGEVDIAAARARGGTAAVAWAPWSAETFARARREGRYVLFDGAAEWCHWCHVMDETTYRDPAVVRRIAARFIAVRVDVDARPDLADRYAAWGWPATVLFSPDGRELEKYRGYLPPERLSAILDAAGATPDAGAGTPEGGSTREPALDPGLDPEALATLGPWVARSMDDVYDPAQGSWGAWQKVALGANVAFELRRAAHGDLAAGERARFTLHQERALIDPVWGGVCQYSAGSTWTEPHFEKLMAYQAATIEAGAAAWTLAHNAEALSDARRVEAYLARFLTDPSGTFLPSQDADVNAHDRGAPFIDGHVYYALDDSHRRALGMPRVDPHVYARDNGLAIAALAALHRASPDPATLARATRAADRCLAALVTPDGTVRRTPDAASDAPRYLADAAVLGRGLALLSSVGAPGDRVRYLAAARSIAAGIRRDFRDPQGSAPQGSALWDRAGDPDGPIPRARSVEANVAAARFFSALSAVTGEAPPRDEARAILAAVATPAALASLGRNLGELLLALDDAGVYPWTTTGRSNLDLPGEHHVLTVAVSAGSLEVSVRPTDGQHINRAYPAGLSLEARGASVPASLRRSDAVEVTDDRLVFRAQGQGPNPGTPAHGAVIRGALRFALCGAETCVPQTRWFTVTAP